MKKAYSTVEIMPLLIFLLVFLVIMIWFIFFNGGLEKLDSLIPYFIKNESVVDHSGTKECQNEVARIGRNGYIYVSGVETNLYLENGKIYVDIPWKYDDYIVGELVRNKITHRTEVNADYIYVSNQEQYQKIKKNLDLEKLNVLANSYRPIDKNYFCKDDLQIESMEKEKQCIETCEIHNGECKNECNLNDEVFFGKLNCENKCCAKKIDEKLSDQDFIIQDLKVLDEKNSDILNGNFIKNLYIDYNINANISSNPYCFLIRTNNDLLKNGFGNIDNSFINFNKDDNLLEIVFYMPWENKFVFKRIEVGHVERVYDGKRIFDSDFKSEVINSNVNLFVLYRMNLYLDKEIVDDFRIIKTGDELEIAGKVNGEWKELDCSSWPLKSAIKISDIKDKFSDTIQGCSF